MVGNVTIARRLVSATNDVFQTMLMMTVHAQASREGKAATCASDISSMIGLAGDVRGMLAVHCPKEVAMAMAGAMLGTELESLDDDVKDAVGEVTNMVTGGMKSFFEKDGTHIQLSVPTTLIGHSYRIGGLFGAQRIMVPFQTDAGIFWVEFKFLAAAGH